jgi:hypothetical protein
MHPIAPAKPDSHGFGPDKINDAPVCRANPGQFY